MSRMLSLSPEASWMTTTPGYGAGPSGSARYEVPRDSVLIASVSPAAAGAALSICPFRRDDGPAILRPGRVHCSIRVLVGVLGLLTRSSRWPLHAHAVFAGRWEGLPLPDVSVCLAVAIAHSPPIEAASVANMAALPATRAMTPATSASAPLPVSRRWRQGRGWLTGLTGRVRWQWPSAG